MAMIISLRVGGEASGMHGNHSETPSSVVFESNSNHRNQQIGSLHEEVHVPVLFAQHEGEGERHEEEVNCH